MVRKGSRVQISKVAPKFMNKVFSAIRGYWYDAYPTNSQKCIDGGVVLAGLGVSTIYLGLEGDLLPVTTFGSVVSLVGISIALLGCANKDIAEKKLENDYEDLVRESKRQGYDT